MNNISVNTSGLSAFQGDASLRAQLIKRLKAQADGKRLKPGPLAWDGEKGSVVGSILQSEDLSEWESGLGLPQWLAVLIDAVSADQGTVEGAATFGAATLEAIPVGTDLNAGGSRLIVQVLDDLEKSGAAALADPVAKSLGEVRSLHQRCLAGDLPGAAEWRQARKAATAATDAATSPWDLACGRCVETAAWNPVQSRSAVFDTLRLWRNALCQKVLLDFGWDKNSDIALNALCQSLHDRYVKDQPKPARSVMDLLAEHHPEEAARLHEKSRLYSEAFVVTGQRTRAMLNEVLSAKP